MLERFVFTRIEGLRRVGKRLFGNHGELVCDIDGGVGQLMMGDRVAALVIERIPTPPGQPELFDFSFLGEALAGRGSACIRESEGERHIEGRLFPRGAPHAAFSGQSCPLGDILD